MTSEPLPQTATIGARGAATVIVVAAVTMFAVRLAGPVLVPILVSILLAYAIEPLMAALGHLHVPRVVAAIVV